MGRRGRVKYHEVKSGGGRRKRYEMEAIQQPTLWQLLKSLPDRKQLQSRMCQHRPSPMPPSQMELPQFFEATVTYSQWSILINCIATLFDLVLIQRRYQYIESDDGCTETEQHNDYRHQDASPRYHARVDKHLPSIDVCCRLSLKPMSNTSHSLECRSISRPQKNLRWRQTRQLSSTRSKSSHRPLEQ